MSERPQPDQAPEGFVTVRLGDLFALRREPGRPGLPIMSVTMEDGLVARASLDRRVETTLRPEEHILARKGDIAYNMMRMWQGASGLAKEDCLLSPAYVVLRPLNGICSEFAVYLFKAPQTITLFHRYSQGITGDRLRLYFRDFKQIQVTMPASATTQNQIAEILDAVEADILAAEALIAKLRQVKVGLQNDLLARGIDEQGQMRDPVAHPEQFKASSLGCLPGHWSLRELRDCLLEPPQNGVYKPAGAIGTGTLIVGQTAITEERLIDYTRSRRAIITESERVRFSLREGDLLLSRVFATVEGVGQPALVLEPTEPAVYESNMLRLRVDQRVIRTQLLFRCLQHPYVRQALVRASTSSNQSSINQTHLLQLAILVPPIPEQDAMLHAIDTFDSQIRDEEASRDKLKLQKRGWMQDLLTGRIRVEPQENQP